MRRSRMNLGLMTALMYSAMGAQALGMSDPSVGRIKPRKQRKPRREYTPEQEVEIERLKADRSSPGRKKLKLYMKSIREA